MPARRLIVPALAAALLALATLPAQADTLAAGSSLSSLQISNNVTALNLHTLTLPSTEYFAGLVGGSGTAFSDTFTFALGSGANFSSAAGGDSLAVNLSGLLPTVSASPLPLTLSLYEGGLLLGSSSSGSLAAPITDASGGVFALVVSGTVPSGALGAGFDGSFRVAAVPDPGAAVMLLTGLTLLGAALLRRGRRV